MFPRFCLLCLLAALPALSALADEGGDRARLARELLQMAGTALVFDDPAVQRALADPLPHLAAPRERLLARAGLQAWAPPRIWLLRQDGERWRNLAEEPLVAAAAEARGLVLLPARPLPSAELLLPGLLRQEEKMLPGLLAAHGADTLVLVTAAEWTLLRPGLRRQSRLPADPALLPALLAETLAQAWHWPEAGGRALVQVEGVTDLKALLAVQSALQALPGSRQVQLVRTAGDRAWFAFAAPGGDALRQLLDSEPRLPARPAADGGLGRSVLEARRLAGLLPARRWAPELAPPPSPVTF